MIFSTTTLDRKGVNCGPSKVWSGVTARQVQIVFSLSSELERSSIGTSLGFSLRRMTILMLTTTDLCARSTTERFTSPEKFLLPITVAADTTCSSNTMPALMHLPDAPSTLLAEAIWIKTPLTIPSSICRAFYVTFNNHPLYDNIHKTVTFHHIRFLK